MRRSVKRFRDRFRDKRETTSRAADGSLPDSQPDQTPTTSNAPEPDPQTRGYTEERTEIHGLFTMFEPDQPEVDIVAIHGLNGHYLRTWTEGSSNWLRDFLPEDLPTARIMSLGYDSRVAFSSSVGNIERFADQLLAYLNRERKEPTTQDRPLIFICHSMGGLVMKQVYHPSRSYSFSSFH